MTPLINDLEERSRAFDATHRHGDCENYDCVLLSGIGVAPFFERSFEWSVLKRSDRAEPLLLRRTKTFAACFPPVKPLSSEAFDTVVVLRNNNVPWPAVEKRELEDLLRRDGKFVRKNKRRGFCSNNRPDRGVPRHAFFLNEFRRRRSSNPSFLSLSTPWPG